jgi:hypothetical protein
MMTPRQLEIIQHALGCNKYGMNDHPNVSHREPYYRNHFCAGDRDEDDCKALVALGYMVQHKTTDWLPYYNCSVTSKGIRAMLEESPRSPKLTRSQKRYRAWLDADCEMTFFEWMKYKPEPVQNLDSMRNLEDWI